MNVPSYIYKKHLHKRQGYKACFYLSFQELKKKEKQAA